MTRSYGPKAGRDLEADLESEFADRMRAIGALYQKLHGSMFQSALPDRYLAHRRWTGWLEMKAGSNTLSPHQHKKCSALITARVPVFVVSLRAGRRLVEAVPPKAETIGEVLHDFGSKLPDGIALLDQLRALSEGCYPMTRWP